MSLSYAVRPSRRTAIATILKTGLLVGSLDLTAAIVQYVLMTGKSAANVLRFIASGVFGETAFAGGTTMLLWGILFHYCIALVVTGIFWLLYPYLQRVLNSPMLLGVLYGALVWVVMNRIVLPLSNAPALPFTLYGMLMGMGILIIAIGIPISLLVSRRFRKAAAERTPSV